MSASSSIPSHYECLDVDPSISDSELARQYKKLSLQLHPDRAAYRGGDTNEVEVQERYQRITEAYAVLSDPVKRKAYDTQHSVNFHSRLMQLQATIGRHNQAACGRSTGTTVTVGNGEAVPATVAPCLSTPLPHREFGGDKNHDTSDDDDDDDEYSPEVAPELNSVTDARFEKAISEGGVGSDQQCCTTSFSLFPRATPLTLEELNVTQYQGITLYASGDHAQSPPFGLLLHQNVVMGRTRTCQIAEGLPLPYPAFVHQLNDSFIDPGTDVTRLAEEVLRIHPPATSSSSTALEVKKSIGVAERPSLHLVLAYETVDYDLTGHTEVLHDDGVLNSLVPPTAFEPELSTLLPGNAVLAVNGRAVQSADDLRVALRLAARGEEDDYSDNQTDGMRSKRRRTCPAIVVTCCHLPHD